MSSTAVPFGRTPFGFASPGISNGFADPPFEKLIGACAQIGDLFLKISVLRVKPKCSLISPDGISSSPSAGISISDPAQTVGPGQLLLCRSGRNSTRLQKDLFRIL